MKWGVRRYQNKDGSYTPAGKKRRNNDGGRVWKITGKVATTDGSKMYVTSIGNKRTVGRDGFGNTRKESIRDAEAKYVTYLNKRNDPYYESRSTEKLRKKVQKRAKKQFDKDTKAYEIMTDQYQRAVAKKGLQSVEAKKFLDLSVIMDQYRGESGKAYYDSLTKQQRKNIKL